jgi:PQQ enzyme repeat
LHGQTGEKLWFSSACVDGELVLGNDGAVYARAPRTLCALDGETGEIRWKFKVDDGEAIYDQLIMGPDGTVYLTTACRTGFDFDLSVYAVSTASGGLADSPWPIHGQNAQRTGCAAKPPNSTANPNKPALSNEQEGKIKRLVAEARAAETTENAKWFRKKNFTRARELYGQAAALGSKESAQRLKSLPL